MTKTNSFSEFLSPILLTSKDKWSWHTQSRYERVHKNEMIIALFWNMHPNDSWSCLGNCLAKLLRSVVSMVYILVHFFFCFSSKYSIQISRWVYSLFAANVYFLWLLLNPQTKNKMCVRGARQHMFILNICS